MEASWVRCIENEGIIEEEGEKENRESGERFPRLFKVGRK
jgi:hypothetical protein